MAKSYRSPTKAESEKLERARELRQSSIQGEQDILSKLMPTMAKANRGEMKQSERMRKSVPESAREGEAYNYAGYKAGGYVTAADGCVRKGHTKGRMI